MKIYSNIERTRAIMVDEDDNIIKTYKMPGAMVCVGSALAETEELEEIPEDEEFEWSEITVKELWINDSYNGICIIGEDDAVDYFTAWFNPDDFSRIPEMTELEVIHFCLNCHSWDGDDGELKTADDFYSLDDFRGGWKNIYMK